MTQVLFEPETGRLRLDRETFRVLADWSAGVQTASPAMTELRTTGVIDDGQPHATVAPSVHALGRPVCRLRADLRDRQGHTETGEAWVSDEASTALLLPLPDEMTELITMATVFLPALLARFVELGPRPRQIAQPVAASEDLLARLTTAEPGTREAAGAELATTAPDESTRDAVNDLVSGLRRDWAIRAAWESPRGGLEGRMLRVLDTTAGLWLAQPQQDPTAEVETIWPTNPTTVWRYLTRLLPDDDDLA